MSVTQKAVSKEERYEMIKQAHQKTLNSQKFRALMKQKAKEQRKYEERGRKPKVKYADEFENDYAVSSTVKDSSLPEVSSIRETYKNTVKFDNIWN